MKLQTGLHVLMALFLCAPCFGQDRGKVGYTHEELLGMCEERAAQSKFQSPSPLRSSTGDRVYPDLYFPPDLARALPAVFEVVVDGEFFDLPAASGVDPESLNPRDETVGFRVMEVYKGQVPESIEVELNSDLLVFPGEDLSRLAKRQEAIDAADREHQLVSESLDALQASFNAGGMSKRLFDSERERLQGLRDLHRNKYFSYKRRYEGTGMYDPTALQSFFDMGFAIREHERYLIGMEPIPDRTGLYRMMGDHLNPLFFWGEMREDVITALQSPEAFVRATPFGDYDPNNDLHCETLRDLLDPSVQATPKDLAVELLDTYEVVVYGEFHEISDASPEELRRLESEKARVQFRIHELFKGEAAGSIELELNSDMLSVPGQDMSRYAKRQDILEQYEAFLRPHLDRMDELKRSIAVGNTDHQIYQDELQRVIELEIRHASELGMFDFMSRRQVSSWLGDTFYERGGVIQPYRSYLIGVNKKSESEHVYLLGELPESPSRIYWGEESDLVLREMEEVVR